MAGFLETDPAVPAFFTDWLSQPTVSITDDPAAEQGVFGRHWIKVPPKPTARSPAKSSGVEFQPARSAARQ